MIAAYPMITIQVGFLVYSYVVAFLFFSDGISGTYIIAMLILTVTGALALASLVQTFRTDPGYLTIDILEQIKLGIGYVKTTDQSETVLDLSMELTEGTISRPASSHEAHRKLA